MLEEKLVFQVYNRLALRPVWSATESSLNLENGDIGSVTIIFRLHIVKKLFIYG